MFGPVADLAMLDDLPPHLLVMPPDPMVGQVIDSYRIERKIGQGGMGAVYLGIHVKFGTTCVIKLMLPEMARHPIAVGRFWNEMQAASLFNHENIARILHFGKLDDGRLFIRFEFIEGQSLDKHLAARGKRLPLRLALYLAFQVCDALDHVHAAGVVHRDIKPENLLLLIDLIKRVPLLIKVVDFGISKVPGNGKVQTHTGMAMGTPTHMAVEQHDAPGDVKASADVYALAIVIWELLTGNLPWGNPEATTVLYHLQRTQIPAAPPEELMPAAIRTILLRCLSPEPTDRPSCCELAIALAATVGAEDDEPSGTDLLEHLVPRWVESAPATAVTTPNSVGRDRINVRLWVLRQAEALLGTSPQRGAGHLPPLNVVTNSSGPSSLAAQAPSTPVQVPTAQDSPHALAGPGALALRSPADPSSAPAPALPSSARVQARAMHEPAADSADSFAPLLAGLPTGGFMLSQKFAAAQPPIEARVSPVIVSSGLVIATGTPGPQPYAHAELPRVVVSTLSQLTPQPNADVRKIHPVPEPPPLVLLPGATLSSARPVRRKFVLLSAAACVLVVVAGLVVVHPGSFSNRGEATGSASSTKIDLVAAGSSSDAGPTAIASAMDAARDTHIGSAATTDRLDSTIEAGLPPTTEAQPANAPSGTSHRAVEPPPQSVQKTSQKQAAGAPPSEDRTSKVAPKPSPGDVAPRPVPVPKSQERAISARATAKTGILRVEVDPWADVNIDGQMLDGKPLTRTTPLTIELSAGRHRVTLTKGKNLAMTVDVVITPNETTNVKRSW